MFSWSLVPPTRQTLAAIYTNATGSTTPASGASSSSTGSGDSNDVESTIGCGENDEKEGDDLQEEEQSSGGLGIKSERPRLARMRSCCAIEDDIDFAENPAECYQGWSVRQVQDNSA